MNDITQDQAFARVFASPTSAKAAIEALDAARSDAPAPRLVVHCYTSSDRLRFWAACGAFVPDSPRTALWQRILGSCSLARAAAEPAAIGTIRLVTERRSGRDAVMPDFVGSAHEVGNAEQNGLST
jgi:hypothetical protein